MPAEKDLGLLVDNDNDIPNKMGQTSQILRTDIKVFLQGNSHAKFTPRVIARIMHDNDQDLEVSTTNELFALANGPSWTPISVNSCVVDGLRYVVHSRDERRTTQNSGICSPDPDREMYYGQLQEILEFKYLLFKVALFRVKWFGTSNKGRKVNKLVLRNNMEQINIRAEAFKDDQYIL
ncbi:hypothetical protein Tco_1071882, partial [Tanacetum coccineum]